MLKVLEGESTQTLNNELKFFRERALPDLSNNIKCGNSLIGPDFYNQGEMNFLDDEEKMRINVFDWNAEFTDIMSQGGFDVVIGNPPYGSSFEDFEKNYLTIAFSLFREVTDIYLAFIEKAFSICKDKGLVSYIIPSSWTGGPRYLRMREYLLSKNINKIVQLPFDIFYDAYIDTLVFIIENSELNNENFAESYSYNKKVKLSKIELNNENYQQIKQVDWLALNDKKIIFDLNSLLLVEDLRKKNKVTFQDIITIKRGVLFDKSLLTDIKSGSNYHKYFEGDIYRYKINIKTSRWLEFGEKLKEKPKEFTWFEGDRILLRRLVNRKQRIMAQLVDDTFITNKNLYSIKIIKLNIDYKALLGIINSKLISYLYIKQVSQATKDDFPQITIKDFIGLPFPELSIIDNYSSKISTCVQIIIDLILKIDVIKTPTERTAIERQIQATDAQIDQLVYQLYGLTKEEIKIVEGNDNK